MRGGGRDDEEAAHKLKSMDVDKLENGANGADTPPRPALKYHGWRAMPFIIGNETFEKLGTLGTSANLLVYLTQVFHMRSVDAATLLNGLNGTTSLAPIIGAFLSDAYLGRYLALAIASVASLIGMFLLTMTAGAEGLHPAECGVGEACEKATSGQFAVLFISFAFLVLGSAGIRPCSMPFGADQFDPHTESGKRGINSFFNWYYFTFTSAMLVSATVIIYVQSNVSWPIGLGIPTALMFLACVLFFLGTRLYVRVTPEGSPFTSIVQVFAAAARKRSLKQPKDPKQDLFDPPHTSAIVTKLAHTDQFRCLDKAAIVAGPDEVRSAGGGGPAPANPWRLCSVQQVEEVKCLIRIVPVWSTGIIYYVAVVQQSTYVVLSALQSDRHLGKSFQIPAASFTVFAMLAQTLWIPIYDRLLAAAPPQGHRQGRGAHAPAAARHRHRALHGGHGDVGHRRGPEAAHRADAADAGDDHHRRRHLRHVQPVDGAAAHGAGPLRGVQPHQPDRVLLQGDPGAHAERRRRAGLLQPRARQLPQRLPRHHRAPDHRLRQQLAGAGPQQGEARPLLLDDRRHWHLQHRLLHDLRQVVQVQGSSQLRSESLFIWVVN
uniref:Uncharacterized protein n=1 Tax=Oryza brachyantha TaxID=4533 RepID=J3LRP0_ORYBR